MPQVTYRDPGTIDGDPAEVAHRVREDLRNAAPELEQWLSDAALQLRSAAMSAILQAEPGIDPGELADRWNRSGEAKRVQQLQRLAVVLREGLRRA